MEQNGRFAGPLNDPSTEKTMSSKMGVDAGGDDTAQRQSLRNPLILRTILKNLSTRDLLNCSLVSKGWNYEARCVIRDFRVCHVGISRNASPCLALKELNADLSRMSVIPYTGLEITLEFFRSGMNCVGSKILHEYYDFIVSRWPLKSLKLYCAGGNGNNHSCPALQLMNILLREKSGSLQNICVDCDAFSQNYFSPHLYTSERLSMPKLKALELNGWNTFPNFLPVLVSAAPNLEELWVTGLECNFWKVLPREKVKALKTLQFEPWNPDEEESYRNFALAGPQLCHLEVHQCEEDDLNFTEQKRFWELLGVILESSSGSLEELRFELLPAVMLGKFTIQPLRKVTTFHLEIDFTEIARSIRPLLRGVNFSKLFPNLTLISIDSFDMPELEIPEDFYDNWEIEVDGAAAISSIHMSDEVFKVDEVQFLSQVFPNIVSVEASMNYSNSDVLCTVWDSWPSLESINILLLERGIIECTDADAVFCGIDPEEVELLRGEDEEFLKKLQIVPLRPSITCCRRLKKIRFRHLKDLFQLENVPSVPVFLPKVMDLVAFKRMPDLEVIVE